MEITFPMVQINVDESEMEDVIKGFFEKKIELVSKDQMKQMFRHKTHKCALNKCRREIKIEEVKQHYFIHFREAKLWDNIVPLEGEKIVESYYCNL